jgi:hypothetical protein
MDTGSDHGLLIFGCGVSFIDPVDLERRVGQELLKLRVRRHAERALASEERGPFAEPEILTLRERLARPRTPTLYRIDRWQPPGSRVMLAAQFKAGKTTLIGNYIRCLADGDDWLGQDLVSATSGAIALLDFEMAVSQLDDWLQAQRIRRDDKVIAIPMRGYASAFDILDPHVRDRWVKRLKVLGAEALILDCLRPVLDALGLDEHRDAGRFLVAFDALLREADIADAVVVHQPRSVPRVSQGHTSEVVSECPSSPYGEGRSGHSDQPIQIPTSVPEVTHGVRRF